MLSTLPFSVISNPTPTALFLVLSLWLDVWSHHNWWTILLKVIMNLQMSSLGTLAPEAPWYVFYAKRCHVYLSNWGLTHNAVICWYSDLISHTHTQTHTAHSGASRLTHPYKYIFAPTVMCSQQQGLTYLFEVLLWKFILSQPYVQWIKMKTYSPTNCSSPLDKIVLTVTEKRLLSETTIFQVESTFICSNLAILTLE